MMRYKYRRLPAWARVAHGWKEFGVGHRATKRINRSRGEVGSADHRFCGPRFFQSKNRGPQTRRSALLARFFDRALGTVQEYNEKLKYIDLNPVRAGWRPL